ncbi:hypothetical protein KSS87_008006 [Heliosperma pusillum]|nr:hypothetical protein KSS87_008006 [Heliosperma pusillum]
MVDDGLKNRRFLVEYNTAKCDCKLFERTGFVCRHIIWVWKGRKVYKIPEPYFLTRWTKKSYRPIVYDENGKVVEYFDEGDRVRGSREKNQKTRKLRISSAAKLHMKSTYYRHIRQRTREVRKDKCRQKRRLGSASDDDERETDDEERKHWITIELLQALTNVEAAEAREEYMQKELDSLEAQLKFLEAEKDGMRRQLEEKQYIEADMDGQFIAGVKALKKSYTRVHTSIPDNWSAVLEDMELMHAYKNTLRDDFLEGERSVQGPQNKRARRE